MRRIFLRAKERIKEAKNSINMSTLFLNLII